MCAWGSDEDNYPQYASVRAGTSDYNADIKSEKTFEQFITVKIAVIMTVKQICTVGRPS